MAKPTLQGAELDVANRDWLLDQQGLLGAINDARLQNIINTEAENKQFLENRRTYGDLAPAAGAIVASLAAAPFTGGLSLAPTLALMGGAGAVGGGVGSLVGQQFDAREGTDFGNVFEEALLSGTINAGTAGLGRAFQVARAGGSIDDLITMSGDDIGSFLAGSRASRAAGFADEAIGTTDDVSRGKIGRAAFREQGRMRGIAPGSRLSGADDLTAAQADDLNNFLDNTYKIKRGSLETQIDDLGTKIRADEKALGKAIESNNIRFGKGEVKGVVDDIYKELDQVPGLRPTENKTVADYLRQLRRVKTVKSATQARRQFQDAINFSRNSSAVDPLNEKAAEIIRRNLNKLISNKTGGAIADINKRLSTAYRAQSYMLRANNPNSLVNAVKGTNITSRILDSPTVDSAQSKILGMLSGGGRASGQGGRMGWKLAETLATPAGQAGSIAAGQTGIRSLMEQFDANDPMDAEILADLEFAAGGEMGGEMTPQIGAGLGMTQAQPGTLQAALADPAVIQQLMFADLQATGGENIGALNAIFEIGQLSQGGQQQLSASQEKALTQFSSAEAVLDELLQDYQDAGGGQGRIGGTIANIGGTVGLNDQASIFNQRREAAMSLLARALGEVGVLTDQDIKRALGNVPKITDNPEEARGKIEGIYNLLAQLKQISLQNPGATQSDEAAQVEALINAGGL